MRVDVPAAAELGSLSISEATAEQHAEQYPEQHVEQLAEQHAQPSREPLPAERSLEEAGLIDLVANRYAVVGTTAPVQPALTAAHQAGHQHVQLMRQLPVSPNATTRPFHAFLGSADRQRHVIHRAPAVVSGYVYVPEMGLVRVVPLGELAQVSRGAASGVQSFAGRLELLGVPASEAATGGVALDSAAADATQAAAPAGPGQLSQPSMPQLKVLRDMHQFWKLWADGDQLNGKGPVRDLPPELKSKKKQRYCEWSRAAENVAGRVAKMPSSSAGPSPNALAVVLDRLEEERKATGDSMPKFIKALGKELSAAEGVE